MTCKSHAFLLVFAILGIAPDALTAWSIRQATPSTIAALSHGASIAESAKHHYRCGLGPMMMLVFGVGVVCSAMLVTFLIGSLRRSAQIRKASPEVISQFVAGAVLQLTRRVHNTACVLGLVAMGLAFALGSTGCGLMLCILSMIVASRGSACTMALQWLERGASVERRANALIASTPSETVTIHAARWLFDDAQRAVVPAATVLVR